MVKRHGRVGADDIVHAALLARDSRHGFDVGQVLGHGGALDGAMEGPCDQASPGKHGGTEEGEDSADADEDGSIGEVGLLHKRRVGRVWHLLVGNAHTGEGWKANEAAYFGGDGWEGVAVGLSGRRR